MQTIINSVKLQYSPANNYTDQQLLDIVNAIQIPKDILSEICKTDTISIKTIADNAFCTETQGLDFSLIKTVTVDGTEYKPAIKNYTGGNVYTNHLNDILFVYPKPKETDKDIFVTYYKNRPKYSSLTEKADLKDEYKELLKLGVLIFIAKANDDEKANNYIADFDYLINQIKGDKNVSNNNSGTIENVYGW